MAVSPAVPSSMERSICAVSAMAVSPASYAQKITPVRSSRNSGRTLRRGDAFDMTQANTLGNPLSPPDMAASGGRLSGALPALRKLFLGRKYEAAIQDIQTAAQCSRRTAERLYAGQRVNSDTAMKLITAAELGGAVLEDALRRVPLERRADAATALRDAADLIRMEAEHEQLARDMAETRARR